MSKMAAKSKKRLSKIENKLLKLEKLELSDVICSICQSILIEPVTLPCYHDFCKSCFNGSIENNALCCPLCRLRIGSWLRTATKQKNFVNIQLWNFIKNKFVDQIDKKLKGEDDLSADTPLLRISAPGEIRTEYEAELKRLRAERLRIEQQEYDKTELLIKKLKEEEEEAHKKYLESIKQDEALATQLAEENVKSVAVSPTPKSRTITVSLTKPRLRPTTIDRFLKKSSVEATITDNSPQITEDNSSTDVSTPIGSNKSNSRLSPEMLPNYGKTLKNFLDKKVKTGTRIWNKENGKRVQDEKEECQGTDNSDKSVVKTKIGIQSLLVSLPLPHSSILNKTHAPETRNIETSSVDSMQQELCYFKPIEGTTPTSFNTIKGLPLRVPCIRVDNDKDVSLNETPPSRAQYIDGLCRLRNFSLANKLPSAFVIVLGLLQSKKHSPKKCVSATRSRGKKNASNHHGAMVSSKRTVNRPKDAEVDGITKINSNTKRLRRTRSMGSISKDNEVTPKKRAKERKFNSERKPYLRSDSKRMHLNMESCSPPSINNNKVDLAVKNLSSPLENCDVKNILREQLRIEKLIEQEKSDFDFACKIDAEWNGRRQPRRAPTKRQVTLNYALRPAKKLKV